MPPDTSPLPSSQPGWSQGKILKGNEKHLKVSGGCSQWHRAPMVLVQMWPLARLSCLLLLWPLPALGRVVARFPLFWHGWILSVIPHAKYKAVWFCLHVYQCCVVLALFYWCIDLRQKGAEEVHFKSCTINCLTSCMLCCSYLPYCVRLTASGRDGFDMYKYRVNGSETVLELRARVHKQVISKSCTVQDRELPLVITISCKMMQVNPWFRVNKESFCLAWG